MIQRDGVPRYIITPFVFSTGKNDEFFDSSSNSTFKFCEAPKYTKPKNAARSKSPRKFDHANSPHEDIDLQESFSHAHQHDKRHSSSVTESTLSESEVSGATTTARCESIIAASNNTNEKAGDLDPNQRSRSRNRRHAINITSNPGYQVSALKITFIFRQK